MNRLKAYVRLNLIEKAREYSTTGRRTAGSTLSACRDAMHGGTTSGWWNGLIYTADVLDLFNAHRSEVARTISDFAGEFACRVDYRPGGNATLADMFAACARRQTWADYCSGDDRRASEASAGEQALRMAVEILAGEVASELTNGEA